MTDFSPLIDLAHAVASHPDNLASWTEGSCAIRMSDSQFAVSRQGALMSLLSPGDLVTMKSPEAMELLENEQLPEEGLAGAIEGPEGAVPSTDALLYAHLLQLEGVTLAVHVQPVEVNQITSSPRARQFADRRTLASEVINCGAASVLVPFSEPGLPLAREAKKKLVLWRDRYKAAPRLLLLQNHGMIVLGREPEECMRLIEATVKSARVFFGSALMGGPVFLTPNHVLHLAGLKEL